MQVVSIYGEDAKRELKFGPAETEGGWALGGSPNPNHGDVAQKEEDKKTPATEINDKEDQEEQHGEMAAEEKVEEGPNDASGHLTVELLKSHGED